MIKHSCHQLSEGEEKEKVGKIIWGNKDWNFINTYTNILKKWLNHKQNKFNETHIKPHGKESTEN